MALSGNTVFITYQLKGTGVYDASTDFGYSDAIHCNYITKLETDNLETKGVSIYFVNEDEFSFLVEPSGSSNGYGFSATQFNVIAQIVAGTGSAIVPIAAEWKIMDLTEQIKGHTLGTPIRATGLTNTDFGFTLLEYSSADVYDLIYLSQPSKLVVDDDKLTFGEEVFFFGSVTTQIKTTAYTTDIPIVLPLNQFNSTTNPTWDGQTSVLIDEIGIYDDDDNLVAIGKLNHPISKDSTISRTIVFAMDF